MVQKNPNVTISVVFIYYNTPREIVEAVDSFEKTVGNISNEVIVVDNNSSLKIPLKVIRNKKVSVIKNKENKGYGAAINQAAQKANGKFLLIVNPDVIFYQDSIRTLHSYLEDHRDVGLVGPRMVSQEQKRLPTITKLPFLPSALIVYSFIHKLLPNNSISRSFFYQDMKINIPTPAPMLSGACLLVRRSLFEEIGGFDEEFFLYFEESDFCQRIAALGYKVMYIPTATVFHHVGKSLADKEKINRYFVRSRFLFFKKYHGFLPAVLAEAFLRFVTLNNLILLGVLGLSAFLFFYRLNEFMMFFGDFGRDFLAARDMLLSGKVPLVGIPSSVVWLHQGPLSIYLIAISLWVGRFNPSAPAYFYAGFGVITTYLIFRMGSELFDRKVGILSAIFFTTSPLVLVNVRMPYHTAPIPFFSSIFLFFLWSFLTKKKYPFVLGLSIGLLLLLELSNAVLVLLLIIMYLINRTIFNKKHILRGIAGFFVGVLPFLMYDLTHGVVQTFGFVLWIANRVRLFLGLTFSGTSTSSNASGAVSTVFDQVRRLIYPQDVMIVIIVLALLFLVLFMNKFGVKTKKETGLLVCFLWIVTALIGFIVHSAPGTAYFPLLFVPCSLLIGYTWRTFSHIWKPFFLFFLILVMSNSIYTVQNHYLLNNRSFHGSNARGWAYVFGETLTERLEAASFMVKNAKGKRVHISGGGFLAKFSASVDNYRYLTWWLERGSNKSQGTIRYVLYENIKEIPEGAKILYTNSFVYVTEDQS